MTPRELAAALGKPQFKSGQWYALCPCHNDNEPSLSITEDDGKLLLKCRANCPQGAVTDALKRLGLWEEAKPKRKRGSDPITATYDYLDETGALRYQTVRTQSKEFWQRRPNPKGGWISHKGCMDGVEPLPYRLPELLKQPTLPVIAVEGEKDVNNLLAAGFLATCNHGGAAQSKNWHRIASRLAGRAVTVIPDNDEPGRKHAAETAAALAAAGCQVHVLVLSGLPEHGDVSDWAEAGGTPDQLLTLLETQARPYAPEGAQQQTNGHLKVYAPLKQHDVRERKWLNYCITGSDGRTLGNVANVLFGLRSDKEFEGILVFDEIQRSAMLAKPVPIVPASQRKRPPEEAYPCPVRDEHVTLIQEWLQCVGLPTVASSTVHSAVDQIAMENSYHPVRQYLESLEWDGVDRADSWLSSYLGAEDNEYTSKIGIMFLVAMIARVYQPGCKMDYILILEGPQSAGKSSACQILGGEWFSDALPSIDRSGNQVSQHLRGKWLIEIPELSALDRAETTALKAFVTRATERYHPPYGRKDVSEPRQCVFIGTTNAAVYLRDSTGGRRFWPVATGVSGPIELGNLKHDRDQIFAEALQLYLAGAQWWPDREFEQRFIAPEQEERYEGDVWEEIVAGYLGSLAASRVALMEVARDALKITEDKLGTADQRRLSRAMERAGWKRGDRTKTARFWVRDLGE